MDVNVIISMSDVKKLMYFGKGQAKNKQLMIE